MEAKKFLEADYLDIVFENRNKAYGSYELRKHYARRVKKAGLFALLGVVSLASFSFVASRHKPVADVAFNHVLDMSPVNFPPPPPPPPPPPAAPATPPPPPAGPTTIFTPPVITNEEIIERPMPTIHDLANTNPGTTDNPGDSLALGSGPGGNGPVLTVIEEKVAPAIAIFVDQMPVFAGDLAQYLANNIRYPDNARSAGIQGRVIIKFIVNEDGAVSGLELVHGIGSGCDEEALRVVKSMPKWKPGRNNGSPVKVYYTQAIQFKLD
jgi:protein TonB